MKLSELAAKYGTLVIGIAVVAVVLFMVIPLPPVLLDLLLAMNITLALIILLVAIHVMKPLDFSSFPTVLLITTLFRLSLNIASTRLILIGGNTGTDAAGKVIQVFGSFVGFLEAFGSLNGLGGSRGVPGTTHCVHWMSSSGPSSTSSS